MSSADTSGDTEQADDEVAESAPEQAVTDQDESDHGEGERSEADADQAEVAAETAEAPPSPPDLLDAPTLRAAVEAILFVVEAPVTIASLAAALRRPTNEIETTVADLTADLDARSSGVEIREVAGGVRLYTRPAFASWVEAFLLDGQRSRLTQAALETLAVIAYRQPVTRARISAIRGVNVDGVVRTLTTRGLITEVGSDPETGGGLYRTTETFLEKMGLRSLDELPSLAPLLPELDGVESDEL